MENQIPSVENLLIRMMANQHVMIDMLSQIMEGKNSEQANSTYENALTEARQVELDLLGLILGKHKND